MQHVYLVVVLNDRDLRTHWYLELILALLCHKSLVIITLRLTLKVLKPASHQPCKKKTQNQKNKNSQIEISGGHGQSFANSAQIHLLLEQYWKRWVRGGRMVKEVVIRSASPDRYRLHFCCPYADPTGYESDAMQNLHSCTEAVLKCVNECLSLWAYCPN